MLLNFDNILEKYDHLDIFKFFSASSNKALLDKIENFTKHPENFEKEVSQFFKTIDKNLSLKTSYEDLINAINSL